MVRQVPGLVTVHRHRASRQLRARVQFSPPPPPNTPWALALPSQASVVFLDMYSPLRGQNKVMHLTSMHHLGSLHTI
jgi:hypothetical protein